MHISSLLQPLHQPPLPPPPHRQHRFPPIISLLFPIRIPQNSRISPKHSCHPRCTGYSHCVNGREHVDDYEGKDPVDGEVVGCAGEVGGKDEAELEEGWGGEKAVEGGGGGELGGAEAEGVEDEDEDEGC